MLAVLVAVGWQAATLDHVVLTLPHPPREGDRLVVAVTVGSIGHRRLEVTTASGQRRGTISAFGAPAGQSGGTYLLPVPLDVVHEGRLDLRLTTTGDGEARTPTAEEVTAVRLSMTGP
jgi:hypothetical protein